MSSASLFLQQLINGTSLGSTYALIALGYTMVYGIVRLINFAHGDVIMIGAYAGYFVLVAVGTSIVGMSLAFAFSMFFCAVLALLIERLAYRPLLNSPGLNSLITAIAVELILQNAMRILPFVGPDPRPYPMLASKNFRLTEHIAISNIQLIVIVASAVLMVVLYYFVNHTRTGKSMQAVSFDMKAASLMGISVNRTIAITFVIGSVWAGAGGTVNFDSSDITNESADKIVAKKLIQVPEGRRIFQNMSVLQNLELGAFLNRNKEENRHTMQKVFEFFPRLKERLKQNAGTLSGGEQQMLAMGRALMSCPKLLLLDEPSMGLSPIFVDEIFRIIKKINDEGVTILLVEQNAYKALSIAHKAYVLETGTITKGGNAADLINDEAIKQAYLGG